MAGRKYDRVFTKVLKATLLWGIGVGTIEYASPAADEFLLQEDITVLGVQVRACTNRL